jgi:hypothetical protein
MAVYRLAILGVALLTLVQFFGQAAASGTELWLAPQASVPPSPLNRAADFLEMFTPDAPWGAAAEHVKVFKLYSSFIEQAPQDQVDKIVADLNRRHIDIALEAGLMNVGPKSTNPPCGGLGLVEGYGTPAEAKNISEKFKKAGGVIRYIAMDEPLWYGHYSKGKPGGQPGCRSKIDEIVKLSEPTLSVYAEVFPGVVVGDIEPTVVAEQPRWQEEFSALANGFRRSTGRPLAFLHLDVIWEKPNEDRVIISFFRYTETLKRQALIGKTGIIYNGSPRESDDKTWVRSAQDHIRATEDRDGLQPDQAIIQSWAPNPTHAMPDSSPGTLTSLVKFYVRRIQP